MVGRSTLIFLRRSQRVGFRLQVQINYETHDCCKEAPDGNECRCPKLVGDDRRGKREHAANIHESMTGKKAADARRREVEQEHRNLVEMR